MNRALLKHWQKHDLITFDTNSVVLWNWTPKATELAHEVRHELTQIVYGQKMARWARTLVRNAGFNPDTGRVLEKKERDVEMYTEEDFLNMTLPDLFGFWCLVKLDHVECASPKDYSEIFEEFNGALVSKLCDYLGNERIQKP